MKSPTKTRDTITNKAALPSKKDLSPTKRNKPAKVGNNDEMQLEQKKVKWNPTDEQQQKLNNLIFYEDQLEKFGNEMVDKYNKFRDNYDNTPHLKPRPYGSIVGMPTMENFTKMEEINTIMKTMQEYPDSNVIDIKKSMLVTLESDAHGSSHSYKEQLEILKSETQNVKNQIGQSKGDSNFADKMELLKKGIEIEAVNTSMLEDEIEAVETSMLEDSQNLNKNSEENHNKVDDQDQEVKSIKSNLDDGFKTSLLEEVENLNENFEENHNEVDDQKQEIKSVISNLDENIDGQDIDNCKTTSSLGRKTRRQSTCIPTPNRSLNGLSAKTLNVEKGPMVHIERSEDPIGLDPIKDSQQSDGIPDKEDSEKPAKIDNLDAEEIENYTKPSPLETNEPCPLETNEPCPLKTNEPCSLETNEPCPVETNETMQQSTQNLPDIKELNSEGSAQHDINLDIGDTEKHDLEIEDLRKNIEDFSKTDFDQLSERLSKMAQDSDVYMEKILVMLDSCEKKNLPIAKDLNDIIKENHGKENKELIKIIDLTCQKVKKVENLKKKLENLPEDTDQNISKTDKQIQIQQIVDSLKLVDYTFEDAADIDIENVQAIDGEEKLLDGGVLGVIQSKIKEGVKKTEAKNKFEKNVKFGRTKKVMEQLEENLTEYNNLDVIQCKLESVQFHIKKQFQEKIFEEIDRILTSDCPVVKTLIKNKIKAKLKQKNCNAISVIEDFKRFVKAEKADQKKTILSMTRIMNNKDVDKKINDTFGVIEKMNKQKNTEQKNQEDKNQLPGGKNLLSGVKGAVKATIKESYNKKQMQVITKKKVNPISTDHTLIPKEKETDSPTKIKTKVNNISTDHTLIPKDKETDSSTKIKIIENKMLTKRQKQNDVKDGVTNWYANILDKTVGSGSGTHLTNTQMEELKNVINMECKRNWKNMDIDDEAILSKILKYIDKGNKGPLDIARIIDKTCMDITDVEDLEKSKVTEQNQQPGMYETKVPEQNQQPGKQEINKSRNSKLEEKKPIINQSHNDAENIGLQKTTPDENFKNNMNIDKSYYIGWSTIEFMEKFIHCEDKVKFFTEYNLKDIETEMQAALIEKYKLIKIQKKIENFILASQQVFTHLLTNQQLSNFNQTNFEYNQKQIDNSNNNLVLFGNGVSRLNLKKNSNPRIHHGNSSDYINSSPHGGGRRHKKTPSIPDYRHNQPEEDISELVLTALSFKQLNQIYDIKADELRQRNISHGHQKPGNISNLQGYKNLQPQVTKFQLQVNENKLEPIATQSPKGKNRKGVSIYHRTNYSNLGVYSPGITPHERSPKGIDYVKLPPYNGPKESRERTYSRNIKPENVDEIDAVYSIQKMYQDKIHLGPDDRDRISYNTLHNGNSKFNAKWYSKTYTHEYMATSNAKSMVTEKLDYSTPKMPKNLKVKNLDLIKTTISREESETYRYRNEQKNRMLRNNKIEQLKNVIFFI